MIKFNKKLVTVALTTIYAIFTGFAAMAADTEIFFRDPPPDAPKPNVLFVMSTGGNMSGRIDGLSGTKEPKIDILKEILVDIVRTEDRINLGFMRFNNEGGPVAYPIVDLETPVVPGLVTDGVEESSNDVTYVGNLLDGSLTVDKTSSNIVLGKANEVVGLHFPNINIPMGAQINSAKVVFTISDTVNVAGTEVKREIGNDEVLPSFLKLEVENSADALPLDDKTVKFDMGPPVSMSVDRIIQPTITTWSAPAFITDVGAENATYDSEDITTQIQAIIDQADWCGEQAINIYLSAVDAILGTGLRTIKSADYVDAEGNALTDYAPKLVVDWSDDTIDATLGEGCYANLVGRSISSNLQDAEDIDDGAGGAVLSADVADLDIFENDAGGAAGGTSIAVGLLFTNLNVPADATIQEAYIEFFPKDTNNADFDIDVEALTTTNLTEFTDGFSGLARIGNVPWDHNKDPRGAAGWETGTVVHRSPDISETVQDVVDLGTWQNDSINNNLALILEGKKGTRRILSAETSNPAKLIVKYQGTYTGDSVRSEIINAIDDFKTMNNQATIETYLEAYNYYTGKPLEFGAYRGNPTNTDYRVSHPDSYTNGKLVYSNSEAINKTLTELCKTSPDSNKCRPEKIVAITDSDPRYIPPRMAQCQKNNIILLSDGPPSPMSSSDKVNAVTGGACTSATREDCGTDLARHMVNNDMSPAPLEQFINSHYIHFGNDITQDTRFPKAVAEAGQGLYRLAENGAELKIAFDQIIDSLASVNTSFVSAGITVNQSNRLTHRDELYFSLFRPESFAHWPGNVKRYRIFGGKILDSNDNEAIIPNQDVFSKQAQSFWSPEPDGNDASKGGAASKLTFSNGSPRKVFSNLTGNSGISPEDVADAANLLTSDNANFNDAEWQAMLGTPIGNNKISDAVLAWINGFQIDSSDNANPSILSDMHNDIGDPLHSKPTILTYRDTVSGVETEFDMVFVGTNHGYVHSFYTEDGSEEWAFIPKELLDNVQDYMFNPSRDPAVHEYGVDGSISIYIDDFNGDGAVDVADGEKAYLYVGLRRGGSAYYAFDITDHTDPELMFVLNDPNPSTSGDAFDGLGQTWSKPVIAKLADESSSKVDASGKKYRLAMVFGGGYDTNQDPVDIDPAISADGTDKTGGAPSVDSYGNNVFIVNAETGTKIWDAQNHAMQHPDAGSITLMNSVPADIKAIDPRTPGYIEHIYATDTAGQIFRFDVDVEWDGSDPATLSKGGLLANIQDAADGTVCADELCNRRLYYAADVAIVPRPAGLSFVSVAMGSGYRARPLGEETSDHFYGIRDMGVLVRETTTDDIGNLVQTGFSIFNNRDGAFDPDDTKDEVIRLENLVNITNRTDSTALSSIEENDKAGWYLVLESGEKVLAESLTFNNRVIFTTYVPPAEDFSDCAPAQGSGRAYAVNIVDGTPVGDVNNDGTINSRDRFIDLNNIGIPPEPQVIVLGNGPELLIGRQLATELIDVDWGEMDRIKWRERKRR